MRAALQHEIREAGLLGKVRLRGHTDEVRDVLPNYDIFVLPSHREGNSNAILEAMAAGLPVISTRVGGTPMLVGASGARYLHEPRDAVALADAMKELIASVALRTDLGGAMRCRVEQCFDIKQVARTYARAYRLLASDRRNEIATVSNPVVIGCA
jgi:glycosyltransferase involved in cell wall biosynthesis